MSGLVVPPELSISERQWYDMPQPGNLEQTRTLIYARADYRHVADVLNQRQLNSLALLPEQERRNLTVLIPPCGPMLGDLSVLPLPPRGRGLMVPPPRQTADATLLVHGADMADTALEAQGMLWYADGISVRVAIATWIDWVDGNWLHEITRGCDLLYVGGLLQSTLGYGQVVLHVGMRAGLWRRVDARVLGIEQVYYSEPPQPTEVDADYYMLGSTALARRIGEEVQDRKRRRRWWRLGR